MPNWKRRLWIVTILSLLIGTVVGVAIWTVPDSLRATKAGAVVTGFAVVFAAVYAWFTYGLWEETAAQTRHNRDKFISENRPYVVVWYEMLSLHNAHDLRTAASCRVFLKNTGKSPANVFGLLVEATFQGQPLGTHDLGAPSMGLLPEQQAPIKNLLMLSGNPAARSLLSQLAGIRAGTHAVS